MGLKGLFFEIHVGLAVALLVLLRGLLLVKLWRHRIDIEHEQHIMPHGGFYLEIAKDIVLLIRVLDRNTMKGEEDLAAMLQCTRQSRIQFSRPHESIDIDCHPKPASGLILAHDLDLLGLWVR